ncbi:scavenger receptor cysteine-rich type 1 protein M130-like [Etheostoma cragini]|uniref:scavenger receptor cysteine-rich type 1 protein M130-like n=1 Tax=Etheostoma cragini TaxID=417921 RepID=UPI00155F108B|nr:scavenger receptor cysteine-rich type 1 protein M130-like [Etheostoma cragini]
MDHVGLIVFVSLWSSALWAEDSSVTDDIRLVGGASRCAGRLEMKVQGEWKSVYNPLRRLKPVRVSKVIALNPYGTPVDNQYDPSRKPPVNDQYDLYKTALHDPYGTPIDNQYEWNLATAAKMCRRLNCGSVVSQRTIRGFPSGVCLHDYINLLEKNPELSPSKLEITCSESVRLVDGTSLCSGRLEVKSIQSNQSWSSVCDKDFDLQDAEVVCRELGCGAPSVLEGALYGDMEAPVWTKEFQCRGHESALLDCDSSDRNTCSSGKASGLTCSEPGVVRLVGGASRCDGTLEMKHRDEWKPVTGGSPSLGLAARVCGELGCGLALSIRRQNQIPKEAWEITSDCNASSLLKCFKEFTYSINIMEITCSDSQTARLVNGTSLCSGRLEVKYTQSTQSWSSVCEEDFDLQDAEVVCRELGCGAPSVLQGALYGDMEAPVWTKEFQCRGHESALLDCDSSDRNTCSSGKAAGLTCSGSDYIRLVEEPSRCAGKLEIKKHGEWRRVNDMDYTWDQMSADAVCQQLGCGSAVPRNLLAQPNISPSPDAVYKAKEKRFQVLMGSNFTISCSVRPQYPGGSFQLIVPTPDPVQNYTLPAVNHSAHFLFPAADPTHRGEYRCVYHLYVFSHNFSSESRPLHLTLAASLTELIVRLVVLLLGMLSLITALCVTSKTSRKQKLRQVNSEI